MGAAEQDVKAESDDVQFVTRIFDHMESRAFGLDAESEDYRTFPTLRNNVFAYLSWGIALARANISHEWYRRRGFCFCCG